MIPVKEFLDELQENAISFYCGVPDSLLKDLCMYISENIPDDHHIIAANEGNALALAAGYHLASGQIGLVYLQNSGLGNLINPLTSLTDSKIYKIPILLIIGWRGMPGTKDEPQHVKQGEITKAQLDLLDIPYRVLDKNSDFQEILKSTFSELKIRNSPVALLVSPNSFSPYQSLARTENATLMRENALKIILDLCDNDDLIISTTGKTSRELFELRKSRAEELTDFLTVGSMGHISSIALGMAIARPLRRIICIDGDGSMLMHMGALAIIGSLKPSNLVHVILNNASHESVGGQPTAAGNMDLSLLSEACGYTKYKYADDEDSLINNWKEVTNKQGPIFFEIRIMNSSRENLSRPSSSPQENKKIFMKHAGVK